jgi:hypothetical protein
MWKTFSQKCIVLMTVTLANNYKVYSLLLRTSCWKHLGVLFSLKYIVQVSLRFVEENVSFSENQRKLLKTSIFIMWRKVWLQFWFYFWIFCKLLRCLEIFNELFFFSFLILFSFCLSRMVVRKSYKWYNSWPFYKILFEYLSIIEDWWMLFSKVILSEIK